MFGFPQTRCRAFTLVELLVVIAIIGVLIALLLPAVQAAREAARRVQCSNHLKQLGVAALAHDSAHGFFPSGGWGYRWTGDPDRGTGGTQSGGWTYAVLPYMEQEPVHALGTDHDPKNVTAIQLAGAVQRDQLPIAIFNCPTRRASVLFARPKNRSYYNSGPLPTGASLDYAGCSGSTSIEGYYMGPSSIQQAETTFNWNTDNAEDNNGVIFCHSEVTQGDITDGTTTTYMLGEKYLSPDHYYTGLDDTDDHGIYEGCGVDTLKWCDYYDQPNHIGRTPCQDTPGKALWWSFGSPHPGACNFVFCDGSVRHISYAIDPLAHSLLASRDDGQIVPLDQYE